MKIARPLPVSERYIEWYSPSPAPSLRKLSSECETEGVSSDGSTGLMVTRKPLLALKIFTGYVHRGALPQSRPFGRASSLREGAGKYSHSPGCSLKSNVTGDFHRPYGTQNVLHSTVQRTSQSVTEKGEFVPGKYEFTFSYVMASSFCRTSRKYSGRGAKTRTGRPSRGWRKQRAPAWRHWVSWPSSFFLWP